MARRVVENRGQVSQVPAGGGPSHGPLILGGVALLLVLGGWSLAEVRSIKKDLTEKIAALDTKVVALQSKVGSGANQPRRSGPDPDKVYAIKTEGSPSKGPTGAAVTIAEFSEFQ